VLGAHLRAGVSASRVALLDAVVLRPWITDATRELQGRVAELMRSVPCPELAEKIDRHLRSATHRPLDPLVFRAFFGQWDGARGQALYLRNVARLDEDHTAVLEPSLATMDTETLVLWGEQDAWLPVDVSERTDPPAPAERPPASDPRRRPLCMEDQPEAVADALRGFLA
jgi:pimeloyl-ACP methyl ester carboxylesterase